MTLEFAIQIATLISVLATAAGLFFAVWSYRHQMNAKVYLTYTKRYEAIMASFPPEALSARFDLTGSLPEPSNQLTFCVLKYLNLCSEEFYLRRCGYLARAVWSIWEQEMKRTLGSPLVAREWQHLRHEFTSYPDFMVLVDDVQKEGIQAGGVAPGAPLEQRAGPGLVVEASKTWYYSDDGKTKYGPYTFAEMRELAVAGKLHATSKAWKVGMPLWIDAEQVPGLFLGRQTRAV
jgi:hypothetical protein